MSYQGWGADTIGGAGGAALVVSNLNDSGAGSLRAALTASGPRVVTFSVAGTIALSSDIRVTNPYLTIDGSTAPAGGICVRNAGTLGHAPLRFMTHDVITRYIRLRPGPSPAPQGDSVDAVTLGDPGYETYNLLFDHCSFSGSVDEVAGGWYNVHHVTFQWCIFAWGLHHSTHTKGPHSMGLTMGDGCHHYTVHHCLLALNNQRNPMLSEGDLVDFRNNVIYGWGEVPSYIKNEYGALRANWVRNYYKRGPYSASTREITLERKSTSTAFQLYLLGNIGPSRPTDTGDEAAICRGINGTVVGDHVVTAPFATPTVTTTSAAQAYADVLAGAGCTLPYRDAVDAALVAHVLAGTGALVDTMAEAGGYPDLTDAGGGTEPPDPPPPGYLSPVTKRDQATYGSAAAATQHALTVPACEVGDLLIANLSLRVTKDVTITPPAGWTPLRVDTPTTATTPSACGVTYWRLATEEDTPGTKTYTWTLSQATNAAGGIVAFYGHDSVTPFDVHAATKIEEPTTSTTITAPSVTTTVDGCLILVFFNPRSTYVFTGDPDLAERWNVDSTAGSGNVKSVRATMSQETAGATGAFTGTNTNAVSYVAQTIAIAPATPLTVPDPPAAVVAAQVGAGLVHLTWTPSPGADGYYLLRSGVPAATYVTLNPSGTPLAEYTDYAVDPSTGYTYRVVAFNAAGSSAWSAPVVVTTLADHYPGIPTLGALGGRPLSIRVLFQDRDGAWALPVAGVTWVVERYAHRAIGGPDYADLVAYGSAHALGAVVGLLRGGVVIKDSREETVWWGYVDDVRLTLNNVQLGVGLGDMANRVRVAYSYVPPGSQTVGERRTTEWVEHAESIALYGAKELTIRAGGMTPEAAAQLAAGELARRAWPVPTAPELGAHGLHANVRCRGWWHTFGWFYYANAQTTAADTADQCLLIGDANPFLAGLVADASSGITTSRYRDGDGTALDELTDLLAGGLADGRRMLATITPDRYLRVYPEPVAGDADWRLYSSGALYTPYDTPALIHRCPAGVWARLADLVLPAGVADPGRLFIEAVEYDVARRAVALEFRLGGRTWDLMGVGR